MDQTRQAGEMMAIQLMLAQTMAFVANQQADRELWVANMREASLRSLEHSLNLAVADTKTGPVRQVREIAEAAIINTFVVVGRAG
jgi:hypothetical protein